MAAHRFELIGGDPALDFINTIHDWTAAAPRDYLAEFGDALRFGEASGVLSRTEARRLAGRPSAGELQRLRDLRNGLERIFRAVIDARMPSPIDLDELMRQATAAAGAARLRGAGGRVVRTVDAAVAETSVLRYRLAEVAVTLLTSGRVERLKACPACGWFFLDTSKNRSRRWCSMTTCGSVDKARRYYWRSRRGRPAASGMSRNVR
jgi:predicted RNA-binding Zn ribbon-like protein